MKPVSYTHLDVYKRQSYDQSMKQFKILAIATVAALIIPILVKKLKFLDKLGYIYALGGIGLLGVVLVFAKFSYGSKLSLSIGGFTFQPSEFVKIIFVFAVASLLAKATDFKHEMCIRDRDKELYDLKHELINAQIQLENQEKDLEASRKENTELQKEVVRLQTERDERNRK